MENLADRLQGQGLLVNQPPAEDAESLLGRSVALHLTLQYAARSMHSHLEDLVRRLSHTDPDTACTMLRSLPIDILSQGCVDQGLTLLYDILQDRLDAKVRSSATESYLYILDSRRTAQESEKLNEETTPSNSALKALVEWTSNDTRSEPDAVNLDLRMRGYNLFAICCNSNIISEEVEVKIADWSRMLRIAGNARNVCSPRTLHLNLQTDIDQDFSARYAAVQSINAFRAILRPDAGLPNTSSALITVFLALYDTLNDDDEEVRDLGAEIVSWILSTTSRHDPPQSLVPPAASHRFSMFLARNYSGSTGLFIQALCRLTGRTREDGSMEGSKSITAISFIPVHDLLASAKKEDISLFVEEKQNMFIDEEREAEAWSRVLKQLSKSACDEKVAADFLNWTVEGLDALTEVASTETDGPLGWTSKPEVFTLGMQIILGAGVVQHWSTTGVVGVSDACISERLEKLRDTGRKSLLHETWIHSIGLILEGDASVQAQK